MPALIFDLDGTLVDTVYAHVFAWQRALAEREMSIDGWRIHRRIGMSGGLFARALGRELGRELTDDETRAVQDRHGELFARAVARAARAAGCRASCWRACVRGRRARDRDVWPAPGDRRLAAPRSTCAEGTVVVARGDVARAKPEPDLFLECARRLAVPAEECFVVGDAVWDLLAARRAGMLGIGVLTGGYGEDELLKAGAYRVYRDATELHSTLDELGLGV